MSYPVRLIQRAVRTIESCKTTEQLVCAVRYSKLITKEYRKCVKSHDIREDFEQACRAEELSMELEQLTRQRQLIIENKC